MNEMPNNIFYYNDLLNDDFSAFKIKTKELKENFKFYSHNVFYCIGAFIAYYFIAIPVAFIYSRVIKKTKIINKKVLKCCKKQGYFVYSNHTQDINDAFSIPATVFPKKNYFIANPDAVSLKYLGTFVKMIGAIPIPHGIKRYRKMMECVEKRIQERKVVTIFPEAHIWPYYNDIRPYTDVSFRYPVNLKAPCFAFTTVYKAKRTGKAKQYIFVDGPFYPKEGILAKDAQKELRDQIYQVMKKRVDENKSHLDVRFKYVYIPKNNN